MLNTIWPIFIIVSFIYAIFTGKVAEINDAIFVSAKDAVDLCITLFGTICLWNGIMQIASNTKIIEGLKKIVKPIMRRLFPNINKNTQVYTEISMNMIANIMGLGNAATPLGLKAMKSLQERNNQKGTLSDEMFMFIVINTASLQIIPTTVIAIRNSLRFYKSYRDDCSSMDCNSMCISICNNIRKNYCKKKRYVKNYNET